MIPATALISLFLFGIDELGTQLEEPFTILPMQAFCDKIYNWCTEIMTWSPGDNGTRVKPVKPEHAYFAAVSISPPVVPRAQFQQQVQEVAPPPAAPVEYARNEPPPPSPPQQQQALPQPQQEVPKDLSFADFLKSQASN